MVIFVIEVRSPITKAVIGRIFPYFTRTRVRSQGKGYTNMLSTGSGVLPKKTLDS